MTLQKWTRRKIVHLNKIAAVWKRAGVDDSCKLVFSTTFFVYSNAYSWQIHNWTISDFASAFVIFISNRNSLNPIRLLLRAWHTSVFDSFHPWRVLDTLSFHKFLIRLLLEYWFCTEDTFRCIKKQAMKMFVTVPQSSNGRVLAIQSRN